MRIWSIAIRVLKELFRDKRTLALMFLAPLLVLSLMKVIFNSSTGVSVNVGTVNVEQSLKNAMNKTGNLEIDNYSTNKQAQKALDDQKLDAVVYYDGSDFTITYANVDASKTALVKAAFSAAQVKVNVNNMSNTLATLQARAGVQTQAQTQTRPKVHSVYNYGDQDTTYFDKILPILMGFFVFLFVFLISGMALLRERTTGTLDRLLATPVKRSDIVFGYMLSYGLLAILQTLVIVGFTIWVLGVTVTGSLLWVVLINILLATLALSFGIFMSTFAKSEFQMMQFIPIIVVPQIFFSGLISMDGMANWLKVIADIMPMKYAGESLTNVIMTGAGWSTIWGDLLALVIFIVILTVGNIVGLKRYRKV